MYNWYDMEGNLIYEGVDFDTSVEIGKQYKLEVIPLSDGYKDYSEVKVKYKPNRITEIYPNPTTGSVTLNYKINQGDNAYISVISPEYPVIAQNFMIEVSEETTFLDLNALPTDIYSVSLIVDGVLADSKNLIKN